jgi:hypothetical protein
MPQPRNVRAITRAKSDTERYAAMNRYGKKLGFQFSSGQTADRSVPASTAKVPNLEEGKERSMKRRQELIRSLANRTTTASRARALQRMYTQFGVQATRG